MARRLFFVDGVHSGHAEIIGDDAGHLTRVLRVEKGQRYEISDNRQLYLAEVELARREQVVFRVVEKLDSSVAPVRMHLFAAIIKFDHWEWMIEKATELGVERITPVAAIRTEHGLDRAAVKRSERWKKILRESSQQCRRASLPLLDAVMPLRALVETQGPRLLLDEQTGGLPLLRALPEERTGDDLVSLAVGPEGGWTDAERAMLIDAGWKGVTLGPSILRAETAALAALSVIAAAYVAGPDLRLQ